MVIEGRGSGGTQKGTHIKPKKLLYNEKVTTGAKKTLLDQSQGEKKKGKGWVIFSENQTSKGTPVICGLFWKRLKAPSGSAVIFARNETETSKLKRS